MGRRFEVPWWMNVVVVIALFVVAQVVSKRLGLFGTDTLYWTLALVAVIVLVASAMGATIARLSANRQIVAADQSVVTRLGELEQKATVLGAKTEEAVHEIRKLEEVAESLHVALGSAKEVARIALERFGNLIVTYHDLIQIEDSVPAGGQIWVLTSALVLEDNELAAVINRNFKKGVQYVYLIPKENKVLRQRMIALGHKWQQEAGLTAAEASNLIKCILVPEHFAYMTVVIYNPYIVPPTILVKLPTSKVYAKDKYPLIYKLDADTPDAWRPFLESLQELSDPTPTCTHVERLDFHFVDTMTHTKTVAQGGTH